MTRVIDDREDIVVERPIPRETIRAVDQGVLVTCTDNHCDWQGLFPDAALAAEAAETHYEHERRSGEYHFGTRTYLLVRLLDTETAVTVDESNPGLSVEENRLRSTDGSTREVTYPRTTGDVDELVGRGDRITRPPNSEAVVYKVTETRSMGLPTWTVIYVDEDVALEDAGRNDFYWINECIAQDDAVYVRHEAEQPAFEVVGQAEHQADFSEFGGGASA